MNLLLAVFIFWGANFFKGKPVTQTTTIGYVGENSVADSLGFKTDDKILAVNSKKIENWEQFRSELYVNTLGEDLNINVLRNGTETSLKVLRSKIPDFETSGEFLVPEGVKPRVMDVLKDSPAKLAGVTAGDIFLEIDNIPLSSSRQLTKIISGNAGKNLELVLQREKDTLMLSVIPGSDGMIGISIGEVYTGNVDYQTFTFFEAFYYAGVDIVNITNLTFSVAKKVFAGEVEFKKAFGGPVKIAQLAAKSADVGIESFLFFLAILSLSLAIINIMPFPVLDGGHLVIIIIETIARREIPVKVKVAIQNTGFVLLLLLMAFIIYNDILSL